jgi:hypothetical protein
MHERTAIVAAIDASFRGATPVPSADDELLEWHDAAFQAFLQKLAETKAPSEWAQRNTQFSYLIERENWEVLNIDALPEILMHVNAEVRDLVHTGWSMFYVFTKPDIAPRVMLDAAVGQGEEEFFECTLLGRLYERTGYLSLRVARSHRETGC